MFHCKQHSCFWEIGLEKGLFKIRQWFERRHDRESHLQYQRNKLMSLWHETENIGVRVHSLHTKPQSSETWEQEASHIERMMSSKWPGSSLFSVFGSLVPRDPMRSITPHRKWSHIPHCIVNIGCPLKFISGPPSLVLNVYFTFGTIMSRVMKCKICSRSCVSWRVETDFRSDWQCGTPGEM